MQNPFDEWFNVTSVEVLGNYSLRVSFDDASQQTIDLEHVLYGEVFDPLRDPARFAEVTVNYTTGTIEWPTGANLNPVILHDWPAYRDAMIEESKQFMPGGRLSEQLKQELAALFEPEDDYVFHNVIRAVQVDDYSLHLTFEDGFERTIDFEPVLIGGVFGELRDKSLFKQVFVNRDTGTIEWSNRADFNPTMLYDWPQYQDELVRHLSQLKREQSESLLETLDPIPRV
jgi:hypothetical protein